MKKIKVTFLSLAIAFVIATILYSATASHNNSASEDKTATSTATSKKKELTVKNCPAANQFYETLENYGKEIELKNKQNNTEITADEAKKSFKTYLITISNSPLLARLENQSLTNNECGAVSLGILEAIYGELKENDKIKNAHQKVLEFADGNNPLAVTSLCYQTENNSEIVKYCNAIIDHKSLFDTQTNETAAIKLATFYYSKKDIESLSRLCEKSNNSSCYRDLEYLTDDLYKKYGLASTEKYYLQLIKYRENEVANYKSDSSDINSKITTDHSFNLYSLASLYEKMHMTKKLVNVCTTGLDLDDLQKSSCVLRLLSLGDQYNNAKRFEDAFNLYMAAAQIIESGDYFSSIAKVQIADMYYKGNGVKKDNNQALEWYYKALKDLNSKPLKSDIFGSIGVILYSQNDVIGAFNNYKKSSELGNSWYQTNLASMYFYGNGAIQDFAEAYAWASVALSIGIKDEKHRNNALSIRNSARTLLIYNSQPGTSLKNANELAKNYYEKYINYSDSSNSMNNV
ncbi:MAG: tetratricopeptide repeat protein [Gammaproteobacteria bacterium]